MGVRRRRPKPLPHGLVCVCVLVALTNQADAPSLTPRVVCKARYAPVQQPRTVRPTPTATCDREENPDPNGTGTSDVSTKRTL